MKTIAWIGLMALAATSPARAAVYLELDFQNGPSGGEVSATQSTATTQFELLNNAGVDAVATGALARSERILTGVLSVPRASSADTSGIRSVLTSGTNNRYEAFVGGANSFGTSTMVVVYRPNFNGAVTEGHYLFAYHDPGNNSRRVALRINDSNQVQVQVGPNTGAIAQVAGPTWDSDTWYVVAASWDPGQTAQVYVRAIADGSVGGMDTSSANTPSPSNMVLSFLIGQRSDNTATATGFSADGDFAYFLWTDDYTDNLAGFDAIYDTLIPEPVSALLLGLGLTMTLKRRVHAKAPRR